jgi:hypothetical protein
MFGYWCKRLRVGCSLCDREALLQNRSHFEEIYGERFLYVMSLKKRSLQYNNYFRSGDYSSMVQQLPTDTAPAIIYPDSDGQPMADNTKQFRWIVVIKP